MVNNEKWEWVNVVSDKQARFFMSLGASLVRLSSTDTRERHLCDSDSVMAIDDSGGSDLECYYRDEDGPPQVYMDVMKLKRLNR